MTDRGQHPPWCIGQHAADDEHTSAPIAANPTGGEILGLAVRLYQYSGGRHPMAGPAVMLTITEDDESGGFPLPLGQAAALQQTVGLLLAAARVGVQAVIRADEDLIDVHCGGQTMPLTFGEARELAAQLVGLVDLFEQGAS